MSSSARGPCTSFATQSTTSAGVAAPLHASPRSVLATRLPGHFTVTLSPSFVAAFAMAFVTSGSAAQSAGVPDTARLSRHLDSALYRESKYLRAAVAMESWHFCSGLNAASATAPDEATPATA